MRIEARVCNQFHKGGRGRCTQYLVYTSKGGFLVWHVRTLSMLETVPFRS